MVGGVEECYTVEYSVEYGRGVAGMCGLGDGAGLVVADYCGAC